MKHRIVVVEDDAGFRAAVTALLRRDGRFAVIGQAADGRAAIELVERLAPDAVVMDIELPVVDGVEATRALAPAVPVVAISGHDYEERVLDIRAAGARDYVRKTRVDDDLGDALAAILY